MGIFSGVGKAAEYVVEHGIGGTIGNGFKKAGMGLLTGSGKAVMGATETVGHVGMGVSYGAGKSLMNQFEKHPGMVVGAALTGMAAGGIIADQDGQADPGRSALKGAALGLGAAALGGAGAVTGLGVATAGAAVMGMNAFGTVGRGLIKAPKGPIGLDNLGDFKLNKPTAIPLILGASAIKGISEGVKSFEKSRMGTNDGMMRKATPMIPTVPQNSPSYANNAGATGDLVFAMHKNR